MSTTLSHIRAIFDRSGIKYDADEEANLIRTIWVRDEAPVTMLLFLLEDGELVQLRAPRLVRVEDETHKPVVLRAMLQMAYEMRLVQFEYEPDDGEVSTCVDIALEDGDLTDTQLLRCCSVLLDVSFMARDRLATILTSGEDPGMDPDWLEREEQPMSQAETMVELAKMMQGGGGKA